MAVPTLLRVRLTLSAPGEGIPSLAYIEIATRADRRPGDVQFLIVSTRPESPHAAGRP